MLKSFLAAVLLSASVERFFVSRMQDLFLSGLAIKILNVKVFESLPDFCDEMWVLISEGLKHLNNVLPPPPLIFLYKRLIC